MPKFCTRCFIVIAWVTFIFGILYFPKWTFIPLEEKSISIFAWGDIFDPAVVAKFEKETGIKVHLNYYSSNEELLVKLKATGGFGYDLLVPSDYAVGLLIKEDLLKPLDRSQLNFWDHLNPVLLNHFFDPANQYSIPFEWELFGFGIDKEFFKHRPLMPSWKMLFDKNVIDYKIAMINDPIEAVLFASFYLYGPMKSLSVEQIKEVENLLIEQRQWVLAYADFRADYFLATKNCPVVVASSSYIWRSKKLFPHIDFVIPEEGTFLTIENLAIPKLSTKEALIYQFINFLYRPESVAEHCETYGFFPATLNALQFLDMDDKAKEYLYIPRETFQKFYFFQNIMPEVTVRNIWVEVKTKNY